MVSLKKSISLRYVGISVVLSSAFIAGCSTLSDNALYGKDGLIRDRSKEYQQVASNPRLRIPEQLNAKQTQDLMDIPQLDSKKSIAVDTVKRPEYFYADSGSETVNFKQDGTGKVLIVDAPINQIWPKAQQFMKFNNLGITQLDPKQGTIESDWIIVKADQVGVVDSWLKKLTFQSVKGDNKNKIQIKLTTDQKNPWRTIISMAHVRYAVDQQVDNVNWESEANNISYKTDMLYELLRFMSKTTSNAQSNTLLASNFKRSQRVGAVLFGRNANGKPALKISGSLDNAWSLVENSLEANQIDVGTKDRAASTVYLTFTSLTPLQEDDQSFLEWLHGDRGPIKLSTFGFSDEGNTTSGKNISYSSKGQTESNEELAFTDPNHPANQEGFKVWLAGKVIYNFNRGFNKGFFNVGTNMYQTTAGYQLRLTHRGKATFITVMNKEGKEAATIPAEELLWRIKDSIPRA